MSPAASERISGFEPISAPDARVLILGTLPSALSLEKREYYGNPQNAFWRVMGELFDAGPELPYTGRAAALKRRGIAIWDVLQSATRRGSMDAAIDLDGATPNDFGAFFGMHPELELICFNGKKAAELYERLVVCPGTGTIGHTDNIETTTLPSTSPAYASMTFAEKVRHWSIIRRPGEKSRRS